jgi:hypothetical protein
MLIRMHYKYAEYVMKHVIDQLVMQIIKTVFLQMYVLRGIISMDLPVLNVITLVKPVILLIPVHPVCLSY